MAEQEFELSEFKKGDFLVWSVSTQAAYRSTSTMKIGNKVIFNAQKTSSSSNLSIINQGNYDYNDSGILKLMISVPQSSEIKSSIISGAVTDYKARRVGYSYSICIEDSHDEDYNDIYINVIGWSKKG